jgi:Ca2+/H+ antiporter, TMEM165/GDT1 family
MKRGFTPKKLLIIPLIIAAGLLFGGLVMGLWNAILPAVLGVKAISFWQALGILLLSKILFGGFGGGHRGRGFGHRGQEWRQGMADKLKNMSPEEKEKFKAEWRNRCSPGWRRTTQDNPAAEA